MKKRFHIMQYPAVNIDISKPALLDEKVYEPYCPSRDERISINEVLCPQQLSENSNFLELALYSVDVFPIVVSSTFMTSIGSTAHMCSFL